MQNLAKKLRRLPYKEKTLFGKEMPVKLAQNILPFGGFIKSGLVHKQKILLKYV
jgi:hypothetical protein